MGSHVDHRGVPFSLDLDANLGTMTKDDLQSRLSQIGELKAQVEIDPELGGDSDAMQFLKDLEQRTEMQIKIRTEIEDKGVTYAQLREMTDEELAAKFNVDVDSEEFQTLKDQIDGLPSEYDLAVHVDDA